MQHSIEKRRLIADGLSNKLSMKNFSEVSRNMSLTRFKIN